MLRLLTPSIQLEQGKEYLFFLEILQNQKAQQSNLGHYKIFAYPQGALPNENNYYRDWYTPAKSEQDLFNQIENLLRNRYQFLR